MKTHEGSYGDIMVGVASSPVAGTSFTLSNTVALRTGTNGYEVPTRGIFIGEAGTLKITTANGQDVTFGATELDAGRWHKIAATHIWATGTGVTVGLIKAGF